MILLVYTRYAMYVMNCENVENYAIKGKCYLFHLPRRHMQYLSTIARQMVRIFNFLSHSTPKSLDNSGNFD